MNRTVWTRAICRWCEEPLRRSTVTRRWIGPDGGLLCDPIHCDGLEHAPYPAAADGKQAAA